jgi:putative tricarboxylic transport membrane protein
MGVPELLGGFHLVVLLIGLYSIPQALTMAEEEVKGRVGQLIVRLKKERPLFYGWRNLWRIWLRSSAIGMIIGLIPAAGGNIGSILSWNEAKRTSKTPERFGTGIPEGVAAAECANSADNSTALIPALTLGVPGNAVAAVILGGLLVHGLRPGPALFADHAVIVYGFMIAMLVTAILQLIIGWYGANFFVQFLRIPRIVIVPIIVALSTIGAYTLQNSMFDVWIMFGFGLVGYVMEKLGIPVAPAVLAVILGPMAEAELRRALIIAGGDVFAIMFRPISMVLIVMTLLVLAYPLIRWLIARCRTPSNSATEVANGS